MALDRGALACAAQQLGACDQLITMSVEYTSQRKQYGVPIGSFQAVKHQVANLKVALEYARKKIRVNAVCPGVVETPMLDRLMSETGVDRAAFEDQEPMARFGEPREIGDAVVWLLSEHSSFVTGIAMPVDGGYTAL
jgi:NAD(P)-dependent dehydrogenase (short-subunit alcohol dehydrogenase family)